MLAGPFKTGQPQPIHHFRWKTAAAAGVARNPRPMARLVILSSTTPGCRTDRVDPCTASGQAGLRP
jgi:hypothetical protein